MALKYFSLNLKMEMTYKKSRRNQESLLNSSFGFGHKFYFVDINFLYEEFLLKTNLIFHTRSVFFLYFIAMTLLLFHVSDLKSAIMNTFL